MDSVPQPTTYPSSNNTPVVIKARRKFGKVLYIILVVIFLAVVAVILKLSWKPLPTTNKTPSVNPTLPPPPGLSSNVNLKLGAPESVVLAELKKTNPSVVKIGQALPEAYKTNLAVSNYILNGEIYIRAEGVITSIKNPGKQYEVKAANGADLMVSISPETVKGHSLFGYDKNNRLVVESYNSIDSDGLNGDAFVNKTVTVGYLKNKAASAADGSYSVPALEFVVMD